MYSRFLQNKHLCTHHVLEKNKKSNFVGRVHSPLKQSRKQAAKDNNEQYPCVCVRCCVFLKQSRKQAVTDNYEVAQPAFELQKAIRRKVLGVKCWEKMTKQRTKMFASYDQVGEASLSLCENVWKRQAARLGLGPPLSLTLTNDDVFCPYPFQAVLDLNSIQVSPYQPPAIKSLLVSTPSSHVFSTLHTPR